MADVRKESLTSIQSDDGGDGNTMPILDIVLEAGTDRHFHVEANVSINV